MAQCLVRTVLPSEQTPAALRRHDRHVTQFAVVENTPVARHQRGAGDARGGDNHAVGRVGVERTGQLNTFHGNVGAILAERNDEWAVSKRDMTLEPLARPGHCEDSSPTIVAE